MSRAAPTNHPITELLGRRWSPYTFDPHRTVSEGDLLALFEAARWAMSCFNAQPWRYIVAVRERDPVLWERVFGCLVEGNQGWTKFVPVLCLGIVQTQFEHNGKTNNWAAHDLGAASAFLTVEASARGIYVHQMGGILPDKVKEEFGLDDSQQAISALAIGYLGEGTELDEKIAARDTLERQRKSLDEIIIAGNL